MSNIGLGLGVEGSLMLSVIQNINSFPSIRKEDSINTVRQNNGSLSNLDLEQALIGAVLLSNDSYYRVNHFLRPEHFSEDVHRRIYEVISHIIQQGQIADPLTVKSHLVDFVIADTTVHQYIAKLCVSAVSLVNVSDYGRLIYDLSIKRGLVSIGQNIVEKVYESHISEAPSTQIEDAERQLYQLSEFSDRSLSFQCISYAVKASNESSAKAFQRGDGLSGISSGFSSLDSKIGGLQASDLIILAGRPGMGKTSLATNIALSVMQIGLEQNIKRNVGFFSLEMSSEQLATRLISESSGISSTKIKRGDLSREEYKKMMEASKYIKSLPLHIDQNGNLTISDIATRARRQKRQFGLDLLIVDYIQLVSGIAKKGSDNRVQEVSQITAGLKSIAKELNIPVIALSQLSRQVENREDKRPLLSDLRDSGSIEQDADIVLFVFREAYYRASKLRSSGASPSEIEDIMQDEAKKAEILIAKNRHGETGDISIGFEPSITKFYELD